MATSFRQVTTRVGVLNRLSVKQARWLSAAADRLLVTMDDKTGVATVKMNRPPVNSLNLDFLTDFTITLEKLENEKSCKGLILSSANPKIYSAGLDILEMYQAQPERLVTFWRTLQEVWIKLYGSRLATIAAINGHSPAGGCLLAMSCDYRIMAPKFTIGLNETQLGIIPPFWFIDTMRNACGHRQAELCCQKGLMLTTEEAHKIGMVDEIVPADQVEARAQEEIKSWLKIPDFARQLTKIQFRKPTIDKLLAKREEDITHFRDYILKESVQKTLGFYLESLKKKKS